MTKKQRIAALELQVADLKAEISALKNFVALNLAKQDTQRRWPQPHFDNYAPPFVIT